MLSKVLGLIYVIPFYQIVGKQGTALYNFGYVPTMLLLSVLNTGRPYLDGNYADISRLRDNKDGCFDLDRPLAVWQGVQRFVVAIPGTRNGRVAPGFHRLSLHLAWAPGPFSYPDAKVAPRQFQKTGQDTVSAQQLRQGHRRIEKVRLSERDQVAARKKVEAER